jgi:hypothetical protein
VAGVPARPFVVILIQTQQARRPVATQSTHSLALAAAN